MSSGKPAPSLGSACPDLLVRTYTTLMAALLGRPMVDQGVRGARDARPDGIFQTL